MKTLMTFWCALAVSAGSASAAEKKPNVLFIAIDDMRDWVGFLGDKQVKTPHLDKLAARGVYFTRSFCAAPLCNPSRAALLTGLRPGATGVYDNNHDWRKIVAQDIVTLPLHFKSHGYYVAGAGKIYHGRFPRSSDWHDYFSGDGGEEDDKKGRKGGDIKSVDRDVSNITFGPIAGDDNAMVDYHFVSYIANKLNEKHDQPFFLACGLKKPHLPWTVPKKYFDLYPLDSITLPEILEADLDDVPAAGVKLAKPREHEAIVRDGQWKACVQAYLATISFCDAMVGRLMDAFDKSGHAKDTIVCCWSDHGWHLGEKLHWHKATLWEEATRAPYIWVVPGMPQRGVACNRTVDYMQIYPTLCDLCGLLRPRHVEGESIRKLLENPAAPWDKPAITTFRYGNHAVRDEQWRYIRYADGGEELYDHRKDPLEWTNLAQDPAYGKQKEDMARWLPKVNADTPAGQPTKTEKKDKKARKRSASGRE